MNKVCYICGRAIEKGKPYYSISEKSYVCSDNNCFSTYWWDKHAAGYTTDKEHRYVVCGNKLYYIGSEYDYPKGFGGARYFIYFLDGTKVFTTSLWFLGDIPEEKTHIFKQNAMISQEGNE